METQGQTRHPHRSTRCWFVRSRQAATAERCSLAGVAQLILAGQLDSDDEISTGDGSWTRMCEVFDPEGLGVTLRALGHVS